MAKALNSSVGDGPAEQVLVSRYAGNGSNVIGLHRVLHANQNPQ